MQKKQLLHSIKISVEIETEVQDNQLFFGQCGKCTDEVFLNLLMKKSSD